MVKVMIVIITIVMILISMCTGDSGQYGDDDGDASTLAQISTKKKTRRGKDPGHGGEPLHPELIM